MTNYDELKKAAEAATVMPWEEGETVPYYAIKEFRESCAPATILALLDEREKLLKVVEVARESCHVNFSGGFVAIRDALKELEK